MPIGERPPRAAHCYRFVLSHPDVDVAICGPNSMKQLTEDLDALEEEPMSEEERARMRRIGDHVHRNVAPFQDNLRIIKTIRWRRTR